MNIDDSTRESTDVSRAQYFHVARKDDEFGIMCGDAVGQSSVERLARRKVAKIQRLGMQTAFASSIKTGRRSAIADDRADFDRQTAVARTVCKGAEVAAASGNQYDNWES